MPDTLVYRQGTRIEKHVDIDPRHLQRPLLVPVGEPVAIARGFSGRVTGVNADGFREILGVATSTSESGAGWNSFFKDLVARGLSGVALVTSGLVDAIGANLPGASWQRCRTHYTVNLMAVCPKHAWGGVKAMLHSVFDQIDATAVHAQFDKLLGNLTQLPRGPCPPRRST